MRKLFGWSVAIVLALLLIGSCIGDPDPNYSNDDCAGFKLNFLDNNASSKDRAVSAGKYRDHC